MVKLTKWTKFLTDYHKKSGNAKLSKSMKEASPLYKKHNGKMVDHTLSPYGKRFVNFIKTFINIESAE